MFVSLNWLRDFVQLPKDLDATELGKLLTIRSAEVEGVVDQSKSLKNVVVGKVLKIDTHPNADKLKLVQVDVGKAGKTVGAPDGKIQIVCGGCNLRKGMLAPVALPGAIVWWHGTEIVEMKEAKVRGETSCGMICTPEEIGFQALEDERELMDLTGTSAAPGTPLATAMGLDDTIIEFDNKTLTHRPDLWGHIGIAREIAAITGADFKADLPKVKMPRNNDGTNNDQPVIMVNSPELCPRYMGVIIRGVKVGPSPDWMQNRLRATDHSVISNIVDVTNYVMEEVGQPMHAFDLRMIDGGIVVRTANKGEKMTTLDGEEKLLDPSMLVIADKKKAIAVAGVMGGEHSGIQEDTVDILLESANFDPVSVRQTSVKLGLRTDSVQRFEKSLDPRQCEHALLRAIELILEICPGSKVGSIVDCANFDDSEMKIEVGTARIRQKIGVDIPVQEMTNYLTRLGFQVDGGITDGTQNLVIKVPSFRATKDVDIEDDIVEEVARMYGYENIPAVIPALPAKAPAYNYERRHKHDTREIFARALGFTESYNYSFYGADTITKYGLDKSAHLKLKNTLSEDQSHLRTCMIPGLVRSLRQASKHEEGPALFELGRTYTDAGNFMPIEEKRLAAVRLLPKKEQNPFQYIKGTLEQYADEFGLTGLSFTQLKAPAAHMHPYQNAAVIFHGKEIGAVFTLHPMITEQEGLSGRVACFEINFESISQGRKSIQEYEEGSKFPSIQFDVSVLIKKRTLVAELERAMSNAVGKLLRTIELFDSYEGDKIAADKKSLAFRLTLQSKDRTLSGEDLESAQKSAWSALEKLGGVIRGKE